MTHPCVIWADPPEVAQEVSANLKSFLDLMKLVKVVLTKIIASTTFEVLFTEGKVYPINMIILLESNYKTSKHWQPYHSIYRHVTDKT